MQFTRGEHIKFLDLELLKIKKRNILRQYRGSAIALLENDEVFSSQFVKIEGRTSHPKVKK